MGIGAAIERNEQRRLAALQRPVDRAARQSIAILRPAGNDKPRGQAERPQHTDEQRGATDAVHIVVAQDHHGFAAGNRRPQPRRRGVEAAQEKGIAQAGQRGGHEFRRGRGLAVAVAQEQLRQHPVDPGALAQRLDLGGRERRIGPTHKIRRLKHETRSAEFRSQEPKIREPEVRFQFRISALEFSSFTPTPCWSRSTRTSGRHPHAPRRASGRPYATSRTPGRRQRWRRRSRSRYPRGK